MFFSAGSKLMISTCDAEVDKSVLASTSRTTPSEMQPSPETDITILPCPSNGTIKGTVNKSSRFEVFDIDPIWIYSAALRAEPSSIASNSSTVSCTRFFERALRRFSRMLSLLSARVFASCLSFSVIFNHVSTEADWDSQAPSR